MPPLFRALVVVYVALCVVWAAEVAVARRRALSIHYAILAALVGKCVEVAMQLAYFSALRERGTVSAALRVGTNLTLALSMALILAVLLLTSLGWSVTRDALTRREVRMLVSTLTVYVAIASVKAFCNDGSAAAGAASGDDADDGTVDDSACNAYLLTECVATRVPRVSRSARRKTPPRSPDARARYVIRTLLMLAIIVAMNFNITHLRQAVNDSVWHPRVGLHYAKIREYQAFRWAFLAYLLLPTAMLIVKVTLLTWHYEWVNEALWQLAFLCIFVFVGATFAPSPERLLTRAFTEEDAGDAAAPAGDAGGNGGRRGRGRRLIELLSSS